MHIELILEEPMFAKRDGSHDLEPFRRTSWTIWSKGQPLAHSGHSYRHRSGALAALERVTGGAVAFAPVGETGWKPVRVEFLGTRRDPIPIEHLKL